MELNLTLDEKSGAEKRTLARMLVQASSLKDAISIFEEGMKKTLADYRLIEASETQIMDVFPFNGEAGQQDKTENPPENNDSK